MTGIKKRLRIEVIRPGPRLEPGSGDPQSPRITNYPTLAGCTLLYFTPALFIISPPHNPHTQKIAGVYLIPGDTLHCTVDASGFPPWLSVSGLCLQALPISGVNYPWGGGE